MQENNFGTFRIGPIRPPSEAQSLLLQVTAGCTWNKCKFCQLYKRSQFKAYTVDSIKEDIDTMSKYRDLFLSMINENGSVDRGKLQSVTSAMDTEEYQCFMMVANWISTGGKNVFLQDGNTIALKAERLEEVLIYLKETFPSIERITSYGRAETLSRVSAEQYKALKKAGLDRIHSGFETGSDEVLELINKGTTSEQQITAGKNIKTGGIELSVYFMPGVGGKRLSKDNAMGTARVVNEVNPDYVRIRSAVVKRKSDLWEEYQAGTYLLCSENEKVIEIRTLIEETKNCDGILVSDHMINLLQNVQGRLKEDNDYMLGLIDSYLALPAEEQKMFQFARRKMMITDPLEMKQIPENQLEELRKHCNSIPSEEAWTEKLNDILLHYI